MADQESKKNNEIWKIAKLIKELEAARGNDASMISLIMPPHDQISQVTEMLGDEFGTAPDIINWVNRQFVLGAVTSAQQSLTLQSVLGAVTFAQQRLTLYNTVPPNGLVLYAGTIVTRRGNKKVRIYFEPFKPINASLYICDIKFHTEALNELLHNNFQSDDKFGFIVMDYKGALFGTLSGNTREVLHKFTVDLRRDCVGAVREMQPALQLSGKLHEYFRKYAEEMHSSFLDDGKRLDYLSKTAELATEFFINPATSQPNVSGLIVAGSSDFVSELFRGGKIDPCLKDKILNAVDVSYGGESGFNEAIGLSEEILLNVKFVKVKRLLGKYLEGISQGHWRYVFGLDDTLEAIERGSVDTVLVWESVDINHYVLKNSVTNEIVKKKLNKEQEGDPENFRDPFTGAELEVVEKIHFSKFLEDKCELIGFILEIVTNKSQEGSQFCRGFGGIGCILQPAD